MDQNQVAPAANTPAEQDNTPMFGLERTYVGDVSVELPLGARTFQNLGENPNVQVSVERKLERLDADHIELRLRLTARAEKDGRTLFLVEAVQAGIFLSRNVPVAEKALVENVHAAQVLHPFLRSTFADLLVRAGLPVMMLPDFNWRAIWEEEQRQREEQTKGLPMGAATPALN